MMRLSLIVATILLLPLASLAVPTGLNMMPTAEALELSTTRIDVETSGSGKLYVPTDSTLYGSQFGLILGLEGGIDQLSEGGTRYNAKWVFKGQGTITPALGVGIQNVGSEGKAQYYLVATKSLTSIILPRTAELAKVHAGLARVDSDTVTMLGASSQLGSVRLMADRINGGVKEGQAYGARLTVGNFAITATRYDFSNIPDENTVTISYTRSLIP